ncbi:MAG: hypothetical protein ILA34_07545 [Bacteroidaceae bacterium]|nr:hypothetical protein [Bacteroidaceae bacterium]
MRYPGIVLLLVGLVLLLGCCGGDLGRSHPAPSDFEMEISLPATPAKEQGKWPAGWIYATLGMVESDRLAVGDSLRLSASYLVRMRCEELLEKNLAEGGRNIKAHDFAATPFHCLDLLEKNGTLVHATFRPHLYTSWAACRSALNAKSLRSNEARMRNFMDTVFSFVPNAVALYGAVYSPHDLMRSVLRENSYEGFRTALLRWDADARPDSLLPEALQERYKVIAPDSACSLMLSTLRAGHSLVWMGDTIGDDFSTARRTAVAHGPKKAAGASRPSLPRPLPVSQMQALHIVGTARPKALSRAICTDGSSLFFVAQLPHKDATGQAVRFYLSENYVRNHTAAIYRLSPRFW